MTSQTFNSEAADPTDHFHSALLDFFSASEAFRGLVNAAEALPPAKRPPSVAGFLALIENRFQEHETGRISDAIDAYYKIAMSDTPDPQALSRSKRAIEELVGDKNEGRDLAQRVEHFVKRPTEKDLFLNALLPAVVANFEAVVAAVLGFKFRRHPKSLHDKVVRISTLLEIGSIDAALEGVIEDRVQEILRGSFDQWAESLEKLDRVQLAALALDWEATREVFLRRNAIVHSAAKVNSRYLQGISPEGVELGAPLQVTPAYLINAIECILVLGTSYVAVIWEKMCAEDDDDRVRVMAADIGDRVYDLMLASRWDAVRATCRNMLTLPRLPADWTNVYKVNQWLAIKTGDPESWDSSPVERWDVSPLQHRFKMARYALLDRHDECVVQMDAAIQDGEVNLRAIREWPLLQHTREARPDAFGDSKS